MKHWSFSLFLAAVYLVTFLLWSYLATFGPWSFSASSGVAVSGLVATAILLWGFARAAKQGYFLNRCDGLLHAVVISDVFLEAILPLDHAYRDFYLCAAAFAVVIGAYRAYLLRRRKTNNAASPSPMQATVEGSGTTSIVPGPFGLRPVRSQDQVGSGNAGKLTELNDPERGPENSVKVSPGANAEELRFATESVPPKVMLPAEIRSAV